MIKKTVLFTILMIYNFVLATIIYVPDDFYEINDAVDYANNNDTVFVRNGFYPESIFMTPNGPNSISLIGEDPINTIISAPSPTLHGLSNNFIANFTFIQSQTAFEGAVHDQGKPTIGVGSGCKSTIANCIIKNQSNDPIFYPIMLRIHGQSDDYINIINCNFMGEENNRDIGYGVKTQENSGQMSVNIFNSIIENQYIGIRNSVYAGEPAIADIKGFNNIFLNMLYGTQYADLYNSILLDVEYEGHHSNFFYNLSETLFEGSFNNFYGNIVGDPLFIDGQYYILDVTSPCIDAGNPSPQYNDLDGSINDIGLYGGPYAWGWETPDPPKLVSSRDTVLFGQVTEQTSLQPITLYNVGNTKLKVEDIMFSNVTSESFYTTFSDIFLEPGDSINISISFFNDSEFEMNFDIMSISYNNSFLHPLDPINHTLKIILIEGTNEIYNNEIIYDDGEADSFFQTSGSYIYANKFILEEPSILNTIKYFFYEYQLDPIDIVVYTSDNNEPDDEILRMNDVEVEPGWNEFDIFYYLPPGEYYFGFGGSESMIGLDEDTITGYSYISFNGNIGATFMIRSSVYTFGDVLSINDFLFSNSINLHQNFPNPFNPTTSIRYKLPTDAHVKIDIVDMKGRHVKKLINQKQLSGQHIVKWDAKNNTGHPVPSGQYFCTIKVNDSEKTIKLTLVK